MPLNHNPDSNAAPDPAPDERLAERLAEASQLAEQGSWDEAFAMLLEEERTSSEDPALLCMLGVTARESGASGMAYDFFRRCVACEPADPVLLATAGNGLASYDDPEAERVLRLAAITAPHLAVTRLSYGAYLAREGLFDAAIRELEAARDLAEEDPSIHYELGVAYLLAGRGEAGLDALGEVLARTPDDTWVQGLYGLGLAEEGRMDEAATQLQSASLGRTDDFELQIAAALTAAAEDWADEAWAALARADLAPGADRSMLREVEEYLEAGAGAARGFLRNEFAAPVLRTRLLSRD
jgi:predicted Zn-dependent protease